MTANKHAPTPETDAFALSEARTDHGWRTFARRLECRLNEAQNERATWTSASESLPENGEWVLHTYAGVRAPEYGLFRDLKFWRHAGPESFPTTHWMRVPMIGRAGNCRVSLDSAIHNAARTIIAGFAANGRTNADWIDEAARIIRHNIEPHIGSQMAQSAKAGV
jgi:hypothetical protein